MISKETLDWYYSRGCDLMPAHRNNSKLPVEGWRDKTFTRAQVEMAAGEGRGVLWRLSLHDLVVDVDLYKGNGTVKAHEKLNEEFGGRISAVAPTIQTPRGGRHYYFRAPAGFDLRTHIDEYGSHVEFLSRGRYVVIAGAPHPEVPGTTYQFDGASPLNDYPPTCPLWLARKIELTRPADLEQDCPFWSGDTLKIVLQYLPTEAYGSHDAWFPLFCGAHYATGGSVEGMHAFVDWSTADPNYAHCSNEIINRWESLTTSSKPIYITHKSLIKEVRTRVGYLPPDVQGVIDWQDLTIEDTSHVSTVAPVIAEPPPTTAETAEPYQGPSQATPAVSAPPPAPEGSTADRIAKLREYVDQLTEVSETGEIERAIEYLARLDTLQVARFSKMISTRTGIPVSEIKKRAYTKAADLFAADNDLGRRARVENAESMSNGESDDQDPVPTDLGQYLSEIVLQRSYADGTHLVYTPEGQYWEFVGTHWVAKSDTSVDSKIHTATVRLRSELSAAAAFSVSNLMHQASYIVKAMAARKGETLFDNFSPPSAVNCKNGEVWIDAKTGRPDFRSHDPKSGLRSCLTIDYDPAARCPQWLDALCGMFEPLGDPVAVAAHLMELIGYTVQPAKNIAAWVLLHGVGNNGKSTVIDVLTALLGHAVLSIGLREFTSDPHAFSGVANKLAVIEDDLKKGVLLPDDILKKLSENKTLTANPKYRDSFQFTNTSTAWVSSNHWPRTPDSSEGMRRRPYVFEFRRDFEKEGTIDRDLKKKIIDNELPGVLNTALSGLMKLRSRGRIQRPTDCEQSRAMWLNGTNQVKRFMADKITRVVGELTQMSGVFETYRQWCDAEGIKRSYSRSSLSAELRTVGYRIERLKNVEHVFDLHIESDW